MQARIEEFTTKYDIGDDGMKEMLEIFNRSLLDIGEGILKVSKTKPLEIKVKLSDEGDLRWASKKAGEYANENGIELGDFADSGFTKVSKLEVDKKVREKAKMKASPTKTIKESPKRTNKKTVMCSGLTKKGESCTRPGTTKPDGAKQSYCFRHAEDFKQFECSSDSSDDEEEEKKIVDNEETDIDDELTEDI
jgi:hypothetical protein